MAERLLTATDNVWGVKQGQNNLVFCSSYNVTTLFQNQQKRSLTYTAVALSKQRYSLWSTVRLSVS